MKRMMIMGVVVLGLVLANRAEAAWKAGEGIANDHATGANARDVTFVARDAGNGYGYRQYSVPIGATLLPWSFPNFESFVYGVRFNFGWGRYAETYGLDSGVFSNSGRFVGIAANFCGNLVSTDAAGFQAGLVNAVNGEVCGVQIGAVNFAGRLNGLQIGFLNFNQSGIVLPLINLGW